MKKTEERRHSQKAAVTVSIFTAFMPTVTEWSRAEIPPNKAFSSPQSDPWYRRSGPIRSRHDFTPVHAPTDGDWCSRRESTSGTEEQVVLERIINRDAVERIIQKRRQQERFLEYDEVPNPSPAYHEPGLRWGVPLSVHDYCSSPRRALGDEKDIGDGRGVHSVFDEVPKGSPGYVHRGLRWGVPLCPHDYISQRSGLGEGFGFPEEATVTGNKSIQTECPELMKRRNGQ